jgi:hypothetical protein
MCIDCAICIILACDVYLPLFASVKKSGTFDLWPDLGKPSGPSKAKQAAWEAMGSHQKHP